MSVAAPGEACRKRLRPRGVAIPQGWESADRGAAQGMLLEKLFEQPLVFGRRRLLAQSPEEDRPPMTMTCSIALCSTMSGPRTCMTASIPAGDAPSARDHRLHGVTRRGAGPGQPHLRRGPR